MLSINSPNDKCAQIDSNPDELDIVELGMNVWRARWLGAFAIFCTLGMSIVYLHLAKFTYTAVLTVTPADQQAASKVPSSLSSLGSLVGVDAGGQGGAMFALYSEAAKSFPVSERLSQDQRIVRTIFRTSWDARKGEWREPPSSLQPIISGLKTILGIPIRQWTPPTGRELRVLLLERIRVTEDKKKALISVSYDHEDPQFARYLLVQLNRATDDFLRERSLRRSVIYVNYLERRLSQAQVAEYRETLARALSNYENTRMMASSDASFAAEPLGDVWLSPKPTSPNPIVILLAGVGAGILFWFAYVIAWTPLRRMARERRGAASLG